MASTSIRWKGCKKYLATLNKMPAAIGTCPRPLPRNWYFLHQSGKSDQKSIEYEARLNSNASLSQNDWNSLRLTTLRNAFDKMDSNHPIATLWSKNSLDTKLGGLQERILRDPYNPFPKFRSKTPNDLCMLEDWLIPSTPTPLLRNYNTVFSPAPALFTQGLQVAWTSSPYYAPGAAHLPGPLALRPFGQVECLVHPGASTLIVPAIRDLVSKRLLPLLYPVRSRMETKLTRSMWYWLQMWTCLQILSLIYAAAAPSLTSPWM